MSADCKIDRLIVEAAGHRRAAGRRRSRARARIADGRAQVPLQAAAIGGEGRAGGDRIALMLDAVPEANRLARRTRRSSRRRAACWRSMAGLDRAA